MLTGSRSLGRYAVPVSLSGFRRVSRSQYYGAGAGLGAMVPAERARLATVGMGAACDTSFPSTPEPVVIMSSLSCTPLDPTCINTNGLIADYNNALKNNAAANWNRRICESNNCLNVGTPGYPRDCNALFPLRPVSAPPVAPGSVSLLSSNGFVVGYSAAPVGTDYNVPAPAPVQVNQYQAVAPTPAPAPTVQAQSNYVPAGTAPSGSPAGGQATAVVPKEAPPVNVYVPPASGGSAVPITQVGQTGGPAASYTAPATSESALSMEVFGLPVWVLAAGGIGLYFATRKG